MTRETGGALHSPRRADVQVLRAVAVMLVVAFHAELPVTGGFVGVDVFFVISGFVIARGLIRESLSAGTVSMRSFYARRVRRLLPLLAVSLVLTSIISGVWLGSAAAQRTARTASAAAVFNANTYLARLPDGYFDQELTDNALLHTWSLSVEEQFYLVIPGILLGAWALGKRRGLGAQALVVVAGAISVGSFLMAWLSSSGRGERLWDLAGFTTGSVGFFLSPARAWEFLVGVALAFGERRVASHPKPLRVVYGFGGAGLIAYSALNFDGVAGTSPTKLLVPVLGAALVLMAGSNTLDPGESTRWHSGLARPFVWVGDRSYAWYLTHWPLIVFAAILTDSPLVLSAAALVALLLAMATHRWVETPFMKNPGVGAAQAVRLGAVCVVVPLAVGLVTAETVSRFPVPGIEEATRQHFQYVDGCDDVDGEPETVCRVSLTGTSGSSTPPPIESSGASRSIFLIGDSHAGHWSEAARATAEHVGANLTISEVGGCPMVPALVWDRGEPGREKKYRSTIASTFDLIEAERPDVVLLGFKSLRYVSDPSGTLSLDGGHPVSSESERAELWEEGLRRLVKDLRGLGVAVVLIHDKYETSLPPGNCGPVLYQVNDCFRVEPRSEVERDRAASFNAEQRAVAGIGGAFTVDPTDLLCDDRACPNQDDGVWLFSDEDHVSVAASKRLAPDFTRVVERALTHAGAS